MTLRILGAATVALVLSAWAGQAQAEIVMLTSGRSVSVKGHRVDGDRIVLPLRTGGEVTCDRSLIDKILPDEVPYPEPVMAVTAGATDGVQAPGAGEVLESTPYGEIISAMSEAHGVDPAARAGAHSGRIELPDARAVPQGRDGADAAHAVDGPQSTTSGIRSIPGPTSRRASSI